ncbi:aminoglycoside N(3)-acetyltransferase [Nonomuraea sp. NPDC059194]|uniref:aminoglycoside N(3)-acetyltransferase n=1 Tax=Nonomuraea sp. NPDC059194 TaxID=3346764 RepID=UPI003698AB7B
MTGRELCVQLRRLGVAPGQVLLVHSSLSRVGEVAAATAAWALREVVGQEGTLVVPTQTAGNSDTSREHLERIAGMTRAQVAAFRAAMPPFDPLTTPSTGMGRLAEHIRTTEGAVRSAHPQTSFAALGPMAAKLMDDHARDCHLGERSPLARLYAANAWILLMGVGYTSCTALHLAEYRRPDPPVRTYRCVVEEGWWEYQDVDLQDAHLGELGADLDKSGFSRKGGIGRAECRLLPLASAVDFAVNWLAVK